MDRRFRALLVHGPYPVVHGFLAGFMTGKEIAGTIYYCEKEKIEVDFGVDEGLAEKLADWVGLHKYFTTPVVVEEERRETAHGIEAYAPEHEFELAGSGTFAGRVDLVLDFRKKLEEDPLIHCGHVRLELE